MKKAVIIFGVFILVFFQNMCFAEPSQGLRAAFIRGNDLWLKLDETEIQITQNKKVTDPKWSSDGKFIAYTIGDEPHKYGCTIWRTSSIL